jgi:hypothetical protein
MCDCLVVLYCRSVVPWENSETLQTYVSNTDGTDLGYFCYDESIKRELKTRPLYGCRCDERLKTKDEGSHAIAAEFYKFIMNR